MADQLNSQQNATLWSVWTGDFLSQIQSMRSEANKIDQQLIDYRYKASQEKDSFKQSQANQLISQLEQTLSALRQNINAAAEGNNKIAGWIQTATFGAKKPGLAGLGIVPLAAWGAYEIAVAIATLAGGMIALSYLVDSMSRAMLAAQGKVVESHSLLGDLASLLSSGATIIKTVAVVAVVGVVGFMLWRNWGSIAGMFKRKSAASGGA